MREENDNSEEFNPSTVCETINGQTKYAMSNGRPGGMGRSKSETAEEQVVETSKGGMSHSEKPANCESIYHISIETNYKLQTVTIADSMLFSS